MIELQDTVSLVDENNDGWDLAVGAIRKELIPIIKSKKELM